MFVDPFMYLIVYQTFCCLKRGIIGSISKIRQHSDQSLLRVIFFGITTTSKLDEVIFPCVIIYMTHLTFSVNPFMTLQNYKQRQ